MSKQILLEKVEAMREKVARKQFGKPNCPHEEIINMYHDILPASPRIKDWTLARATSLRARWNEGTDRQTLDYWKRLFEYIAGIPFLTGKISGNGRKPFIISLDWLVKAENFAKVREGRIGATYIGDQVRFENFTGAKPEWDKAATASSKRGFD